MDRRALLLGGGAALAVAGCGSSGPAVWASDGEVASRRYRHPGPPSLTLVTVLNEGTRSGAHTGVLISASERALFDPAGTWGHPSIPERHDLLLGMTPEALELYMSYHARESYFVVTQEVPVSAAGAEAALAQARVQGPVGKARCTVASCAVLAAAPELGDLGSTYFPERLMARFARLPGVVTRERHETDGDMGRAAILEGYEDLPAPAAPPSE